MNSKTTLKVSVMGISFLFISFLFLGSNNLYASTGGDCDNEITVSGNVETVVSNWGVYYAWKIKGAANGHGARFYDNGDKLVVKLDDKVESGQKIIVTWKSRNYNSSYSGPSKLKVYESNDGSSFTYNTTLTTEVKNQYIEDMFTVNGETKYLKLVNASSSNHGSPDFLVDAASYAYTICNDHCPDGPEPGTPCNDGNSNTSNDVINDNCECEGTAVSGGTFTVCSQVNNSRDDAEEALTGQNVGKVNTSSSDLELVFEELGGGYDQLVGMRFNDLNIPQGATITNAFIQFMADASIGSDESTLNIYGQASDNTDAFSTTDFDISSRPKTDASVVWSPDDWTDGDSGPDEQTDDISVVIQEIVNRIGFNENSSVVIMIDGEGLRTADSYDEVGGDAPILCVTYQTGCHDSDGDGVCDEDDLCEGHDDNIDVDNDGTPDGCDDCLNEVSESGNVNKVLWSWGVPYAWKIKGAADGHGARFYDNHDRLYVKLDDEVTAGQELTVTWKRRNYNSSYSGPAQLAVYESQNGYSYSYNSTLTTEEYASYIEGTLTVDDDTKYLKLVNGSTYYHGSPDFLVDAISYSYRVCDDVDLCPNGPEPGTPCDDGNNLTINDVINANCECEGTLLANYDVCSRVDSNSDDAEEDPSGVVDLTSSDLELIYESNPGYAQTVGMRFNNLDIPQDAVINNAYIQFTVKNASNLDPCVLTIVGETSKDAATFTTANGDISNRNQTNAFEIWEPANWLNTDDAGAAQQTVDIAAVIQEIVNLDQNTSNSIAIIIEGVEGKRIAFSFDNDPAKAPELCINYSAPSQGGSPQGMISNGSKLIEMQGESLSLDIDSDPDVDLESILNEEINENSVEDAPEDVILTSTSVKVFPVPASKELSVDLSNHKGRPARISVYNQLGQLQEIIDIEAVPASPVEMNVENYHNGVYYMNIEVENGKVVTKKFIVNRTY